VIGGDILHLIHAIEYIYCLLDLLKERVGLIDSLVGDWGRHITHDTTIECVALL
jgi:hypothetical protein